MSKPLPYFKWYPADAESDDKYSAMSDAELGFYHRCLNKSWVNEGLPSDSEERARVMRTTQEVSDAYWVRVGKCFEVSLLDSSRVVNNRQELERSDAIGRSSKSKNAVTVREFRKQQKNIVRSSNDHLTMNARSSNDHPEIIVRSSNDDPRAYESEYVFKNLDSIKKTDSFGAWAGAGKFEAAWERHKKHRGSRETYEVVAQTLIGMDVDWAELEKRHIAFCKVWDSKDWNFCPVTLLEWVQNKMPLPQGVETAAKSPYRPFMDKYANYKPEPANE